MGDSSPKIALIDVRVGNLRSMRLGLERAGAAVLIATEPKHLEGADALMLPGVGAFAPAIANIHSQDLKSPILDWIAADKPFFGVCVGMQVLFEESSENGECEGLGIFRGAVRRLPKGVRIPEMGWNTLNVTPAVDDSPYKGAFEQNGYYYFAHSFAAKALTASNEYAYTNYGAEFTSVVGKGNLIGTQFHPEKSGPLGLNVLKSFVSFASEFSKGGTC